MTALDKNIKLRDEDKWLLSVIDITENSDGTAIINFAADDDFREKFKASQGLKRWSQRRFQKIMEKAIQNYLESTSNTL